MFKVQIVWIVWLLCLPKTFEDIILRLKFKDARTSTERINLDGTIRQNLTPTIIQSRPDEDIICSPISLLPPLAKLALGATGKTLNELEDAIGVVETEQIGHAMRTLLETLQNVKGVVLNIVSRLYMTDQYKLLSEFKHEVKRIFDSSVVRMDFNESEKCAAYINEWATNETFGLIQNLVTPTDFNLDTMMILVSVVYFEAKWIMKAGFDTGSESTFHSPAGPVKVQMMHVIENFGYTESNELDAQVLEIPYEGGECAFIIVLPQRKDGLNDVIKKLQNDSETLNRAIQSMSEIDISVTMPKFKFETKLDLIPILQKMGIKGIFTGEGLDEIMKKNPNVSINKAIQQSVIEVNENGTLAASVSVVGGMKLSNVSFFKEIIVDHPFLFYIMVKTEPLFSGVFNGGKKAKRMKKYGDDISISSEEDYYKR